MSSTIRLTTHSTYLNQVVHAFEDELGLPRTGENPSIEWLHNVLADYNAANNTAIEFDHEDYGYWFRVTTTTESRLLGELRAKYQLGGE